MVQPRTDNDVVKPAKATFAGGCFWCMQPPFDELDGVLQTRVGYTGGHVPFPTYEQVCSGTTGHAEAIEVVFDPNVISYEALLDTFWRNIDPTTLNRQFADHGTQYRTAIFYHDEQQREKAEATKRAINESAAFDGPIVTEIVPAEAFYEAEAYHQNYYLKNSGHYSRFKVGSGRASFLEEKWGKGPD